MIVYKIILQRTNVLEIKSKEKPVGMVNIEKKTSACCQTFTNRDI